MPVPETLLSMVPEICHDWYQWTKQMQWIYTIVSTIISSSYHVTYIPSFLYHDQLLHHGLPPPISEYHPKVLILSFSHSFFFTTGWVYTGIHGCYQLWHPGQLDLMRQAIGPGGQGPDDRWGGAVRGAASPWGGGYPMAAGESMVS